MNPSKSLGRLQSVDLLRGVIMIIMALDHTREFVHADALAFQPDDLTKTTALLFFTRWITHFCAPVFMFTAGLGAFFKANRDGAPAASRFLLTRGLWLVFLELTVLRFAFALHLLEGPVLLTILWALGWSMVALAALSRLPPRILAVVSIGMIVLHNALDGVTPEQFGALSGLWKILHQRGFMAPGGIVVVVAYPLIPWIGVMAAGYCLGPVFLMDEERRRRILIRLGLALTAAFLIVRAINIYGDPQPWKAQPTALFTLLSFLRTTKYPPSLEFLLMTLGPSIWALGLIDKLRVARANPALIFGRVPLFYFLGHLYLLHLAVMALALLRYGTATFLLHASTAMRTPAQAFPENYGWSLGIVYLTWITVVLIMYPLCLWFARVKERRRDWWLGYL